ncbi:MAG TPA: type II toxin-antitoxin system PemK/MazF family toxin [Candidatus Saccharibacteria bacterium]|nr:type II toxin-antitoxin system PemK/MazF family toxin [Candidatus Saccharibacteria bacterium]
MTIRDIPYPLDVSMMAWHRRKHFLNTKHYSVNGYKEGDIWWAPVGQNVGIEQNGKGHDFSRPVLVVKGFNARQFWGIPLSTNNKHGAYYYQFTIKEVKSTALLSQLRTYDTRRLMRKYGMARTKDLVAIKKRLRGLL